MEAVSVLAGSTASILLPLKQHNNAIQIAESVIRMKISSLLRETSTFSFYT